MIFGEPADSADECNARLFIGDNYGDGTATMRCQLAPNHEGLHQERFDREGGLVTITWVYDERKQCDHGCGQWRHAHDSDTVQCPQDADDHEYSACTFCHPNKAPQLCATCSKTYYYEVGHKRDCCAFACAACGESGVGRHRCPKEEEAFPNAGDDPV